MGAERPNCPPQRWLSIVGIGEDGIAGLAAVARRLVSMPSWWSAAKAPSLADQLIRGRRLAWPSPIDEAIQKSRNIVGGRWRCWRAAIRSHGIGDALLRSIARTRRSACRSRPPSALPQPTGWSLQDVPGQPAAALEGIVRYLQPGARILTIVGRQHASQARQAARGAGLGALR